uniref:Pco088367b n=1 Tax=Arundo donax TaxID=35708 RepID=A0A0A9EVB7_ARUDO
MVHILSSFKIHFHNSQSIVISGLYKAIQIAGSIWVCVSQNLLYLWSSSSVQFSSVTQHSGM